MPLLASLVTHVTLTGMHRCRSFLTAGSHASYHSHMYRNSKEGAHKGRMCGGGVLVNIPPPSATIRYNYDARVRNRAAGVNQEGRCPITAIATPSCERHPTPGRVSNCIVAIRFPSPTGPLWTAWVDLPGKHATHSLLETKRLSYFSFQEDSHFKCGCRFAACCTAAQLNLQYYQVN
jgi:hypothetical protein